jgi:hypothetical protein
MLCAPSMRKPSIIFLCQTFIRSHAKTRVAIECAFGILKGRWACLSRTLRFTDPRICGSVTMACVYLHNFILSTKNAAEAEIDRQIIPEQPEVNEGEREVAEDVAVGEISAVVRRQQGARRLGIVVEQFKETHRL